MMKYMGCISGLMGAFIFSQVLWAAVPQPKVAAKPLSKILQGEGAVFGGLAGSGFTLLDVRRTADLKKKVERLVLDVGDLQGGVLRGWPGYYFAELKKNPQRLVLDFSQMPNTKLDQKTLQARLEGSSVIKTAQLNLDAADNSLNMVLDLKPNTKVHVYQVAGKKSTSKVVIDLITE